MIIRARLVLTLLPALLILVFPASALAIFSVNSTGDAPDKALNGTCETATLGECTLRAAIEESNAASNVDSIEFAVSFNGENADTITAASDLPTITETLNILGGHCETAEAGAGIKGPCAGVLRSGGGSLFVVDADDVKIEGLAIEGAANGINVINEASGFVAKNDWVGLNLKGEAVANSTGILLGPGVEETEIGGSGAEEGNVIGGNTFVGLDLEGASKTKVLGNYFGVAPDGATARPNIKDIEITNSVLVAHEAKENEIGQTIAGAATTKCDGGCNVIAGATTTGIDLNGDGSGLNEEPASGPTIIRGNFVGLKASGTGVVANGGIDIWAGGADHVTVGGFAAGDANYIAGGSEGIVSESGGEDFEALGNRIGFGADGSEQTPPSSKGIFVLSLNVTEPASIENNKIRMIGGRGIDQAFEGPRIIGNTVEGGDVGIWTRVGEGGGLIAGNTVDAPSEYGILIENRNTEARQNTITNSGGAGIAVKTPLGGTAMTGVLIGGSTAEKENVINGSDGPAIEIVEQAGEPGSEAEITRNHGAFNGGLFIDLVSGANEGILPPSVSTALQSSAAGTAEPGALVRVFRKASAEAGELQSFLAEAVADGSGNWKVSFSSIPAGTLVTATQTNENGATSELATPLAAASEGGGEEGGGNNGGGGSNNGGGNNGGGNNGNAKDKTPPDTKIVKGPPKKTHKTKVKFKFTSTEAGSTFQCKLDRKPFKTCRSPKVYKKLKPGKHVFKVRAIDGAGNVDPTPAKRTFTVLH
jgi:CSLREA domain-containing protein